MTYAMREPFKSLFPKQPKVVEAIREHMSQFGFDMAHPLILGTGPWTEEPVLIDGHTRLMIADELGVTYVPDIEKYFETEDDALEYAIHNQRNRRNLTTAEIVNCVSILDERKRRGGDNNPYGRAGKPEESKAQNCANDKPSFDVAESIASVVTAIPKGKSAEQTANLLGISTRKVEQVRTILSPETPVEIKQAVMSGEKSIDKAYNEVREIKKQTEDVKKETTVDSKAVFNESNDNIEWSIWTWNPVTGCKHGCEYCYAEGIANRFYAQKFEPTFYEKRLSAPYNSRIPEKYNNHPGKRNVFVCSMADLFGEWVDETWITRVLDVCKDTPDWNYLFLTKNPKRLLDFSFPENCWVGTSVDVRSRLALALNIMPQVDAAVKFISFEPLLEDMGQPNLSFIDWIIIGGQSGDTSRNIPPKQPQWEWVESLLFAARKTDTKVYFKPNLLARPKEYPQAR